MWSILFLYYTYLTVDSQRLVTSSYHVVTQISLSRISLSIILNVEEVVHGKLGRKGTPETCVDLADAILQIEKGVVSRVYYIAVIGPIKEGFFYKVLVKICKKKGGTNLITGCLSDLLSLKKSLLKNFSWMHFIQRTSTQLEGVF